MIWCGASGSGLEFSFIGDSIDVTIVGDSISKNKYDVNNHARVAIYLDGERVVDDMLDETEKTYTVFEDSQAQMHTIKIIKLSEALSSTFAIKEVGISGREMYNIDTLSKIKTLSEANKKNGLIEFIGDSITCGYGVDDPVKENGFSTKTEDVTKTYAYKTAEALGCNSSMVSYSGYGVISGYTSGEKASALTVPQYYNKLGFSNVAKLNSQKLSDVEWTPTESQKPDIVVINLGTNDYNYTKGDSAKNEEFKQGYIDFLTQIRKVNPEAMIVCTCGIMGGDLYPVIEQAVAEFGDKNVYSMEFDVQNINTDGVCADWHPSEATHTKASEKLVDFIQRHLEADIIS